MKYLGILTGLLLGNSLGELAFHLLGRPFDVDGFKTRMLALALSTLVIWCIDAYLGRQGVPLNEPGDGPED